MGPLQGIRILELSRVLAGPWCSQILADLGAEVIKIEHPGSGDETRQWGPPWLKDKQGRETRESAYYLCTNRGKSSVTVDMGHAEGRAIIRELAARSDVLLENFRTGSLVRKGLGYEQVKQLKADIIYCSITGFGQTGPRAGDAGYDYMIQGMGGLMSITGVADGEPGAGPQRVGVAVSDLTTGMYSAIAILGALYHRNQSGHGQYIDMALLDTQVSWLANQAMNYFISGQCPVRTGAQHPNLTPYQPFQTRDGSVIIAIGNDDQFRRFCAEAGCEQLAEDDRYLTNPDRNLNRTTLIETVEKIMRTRTTQQWIDSMRNVSVPCGPVNTIEEVFEEEQIKHRGLKIELKHPAAGTVPGVASPIRYSETEIEYSKAPPLLGEDTEAVLKTVLGKTEEELTILRESGVI